MARVPVRLLLAALLAALPMAVVAQSEPDGGSGASAGSTAPDADDAAPQSSVRDVYRERHALFGDRFTLEPSLGYIHSDRNQLTLSGFLALDAIFLGNISVDRIARDTVRPEIALRYDITDRLQLEGVIPWVYRRSQFESTSEQGTAQSVEETVSDSDFGDLRLRLYYRALAETSENPDVVLNAGLTLPTGRDPFGVPIETVGDGLLQFPSELPTGNGVYVLSFGASVLRTLDPAILFASVGFDFTLEEGFDDVSAAPGKQSGRVDLGDTFRFGFGTAFALNRRLSLSVSLDQAFTTATEQKVNGESFSRVVGSEATASVFNFGGTLALDRKRSLTTNVGFGLTEDAPDVSIRVSMPFSL